MYGACSITERKMTRDHDSAGAFESTWDFASLYKRSVGELPSPCSQFAHRARTYRMNKTWGFECLRQRPRILGSRFGNAGQLEYISLGLVYRVIAYHMSLMHNLELDLSPEVQHSCTQRSSTSSLVTVYLRTRSPLSCLACVEHYYLTECDRTRLRPTSWKVSVRPL